MTTLVARARAALAPLFPDAPRRLVTARGVALVVAAVVALTATSLLRQRGVAATDSLWAEDGAFFLHDAITRSFASDLLRPLGGYAHVAPRLVAEVASWLPVRLSANVLSGGAALLAAACSVVVYQASAGVLRSRLLRGVVAIAPLLLPVAQYEVLNTVANLHFVLLYAAFWALLGMPSNRVETVARACVVALAALSDPQAALLAPVALARVIARPRWRDHVITMTYAVALAVQFAVDATTSRGFGERAPAAQLARLYPLRVAESVLGSRVADPVWRTIGDGLTVAAALAIVAVLVVAVRRRARTNLVLVVAALALSGLYWVGPLAFRWSERMRPTADAIGLHGSRYGLVPSLLVLVALVAVLDRARNRWVAPAAVVALAVLATIGYPADNGRIDGPSWRAAVRDAASTCAARGRDADVDIPTAPPGWTVRLPCDRL